MSYHVVALFYRPQNKSHRDFLCVCSSEAVANNRIDYLMDEYPDVYTERSRFEMELQLYFNEVNV